tara:strand:+ start:228 stop:554 length:327 start_codon:yes stop_codon:yes gene_type:complete
MTEYEDSFEQEEKSLKLHIAKLFEHMEWECTLPELEKAERRVCKSLSEIPKVVLCAEENNIPWLLWGHLERLYRNMEIILGENWLDEAAAERREQMGLFLDDEETPDD